MVASEKEGKLFNKFESGQQDRSLQGLRGEQALQQLKQSGVNDQQLQSLRDLGAINQINAQGGIDRWLIRKRSSSRAKLVLKVLSIELLGYKRTASPATD